jgi:hypothetical protein
MSHHSSAFFNFHALRRRYVKCHITFLSSHSRPLSLALSSILKTPCHPVTQQGVLNTLFLHLHHSQTLLKSVISRSHHISTHLLKKDSKFYILCTTSLISPYNSPIGVDRTPKFSRHLYEHQGTPVRAEPEGLVKEQSASITLSVCGNTYYSRGGDVDDLVVRLLCFAWMIEAE